MTPFDLLSQYLLIIEFRSDATLHSNWGKESYDAGHIKCSRGPQVPQPWSGRWSYFYEDWNAAAWNGDVLFWSHIVSSISYTCM